MQAPRAVRSSRTLSRVVIAGLVLGMLVNVVSIVHELSVGTLIDQALAGLIGQVELMAYDSTTRLVGLAWLATYIGTAVIWLAWQYFLVRSVEPLTHDEPLKTPFRSVLWWFVPWLNLVTVPRIYGDLRDDLAPHAGNVVGLWWGVYLLSNFVSYFVGFLSGAAATPEALVGSMNLAAAGDALTIVAAVLAIRLIVRLQSGQDALISKPPIALNTLQPAVSPADAS